MVGGDGGGGAPGVRLPGGTAVRRTGSGCPADELLGDPDESGAHLGRGRWFRRFDPPFLDLLLVEPDVDEFVVVAVDLGVLGLGRLVLRRRPRRADLPRISSAEANDSSGSTTAISSSSATTASARAIACGRSYGPQTTGSHSSSSLSGPMVMIHGRSSTGESSGSSKVTSAPTRVIMAVPARPRRGSPQSHAIHRAGRATSGTVDNLVGLSAASHRVFP
ncbi:hypothetical protein Prubr_33190 [Polymorphospora rubra]|uniref:Uncharacterized protein n=1 Tax=Polymorphospora rubra TaxID=338584 RepID=A0A810N3L2_9ACTN|nr:hypothetical protein Prubr_33190 [Polymorphospora rubra]